MGTYTIERLIDYECDKNGNLSVTFKIDGDPEDGHRVIETDEYYDFAEKISKDDDNNYMTKEWEDGDFEDEGYYYSQFDFREWKEYEHSEDMVKEFIYEYYPEEGDLPEIEYE